MAKGKLAGRRVVVTGASRGVGLEIVKRFLAEGAQVIGVARNRANLAHAARAVKNYGKAFTPLLADTGQPGTAARVATIVRRRWGALDLLINNAAVNPGHLPFAREKVARLEDTLSINVLGPHRLTLGLLPLLRKGRHPRVVNVSSGAGSANSVATGTSMSAYRFSKWCLNGLTRLWAAELKGKISVIAMDPGWVKTDMGGANAPNSVAESVAGILKLVTHLDKSLTGKFVDFRGETIPW